MHKAQILLIEDNDSVREVVSRQLEALGVSVTSLSDGDHVKQELSQKTYDLVIADLHLPNCSGFDIARFANAKNCKIILLSGDAEAASRDDFLTDQFDEVILKPVTLQNLKNLLVRHEIITDTDMDAANSNRYAVQYDETGAIDLHLLTEHMGQLDHAALEMLSRFPNMMRPLAYKISELSAQKNATEVLEIAHSLKGAARSAGAVHLGILAEDIQNLAAKGQCDASVVQDLLDEFSKFESAIQTLCRKDAATS